MMQGRSVVSAIGKIVRIIALAATCSGIAFADGHPDKIVLRSRESFDGKASDIQFTSGTRLAKVAPSRPASLPQDPINHDVTGSPVVEPFDLPTRAAWPGVVPANWSDLQSRILSDEKTLAGCRSAVTGCPQAADRFFSIVELGRKHQGRARLGWINRAVNLRVKPMSDREQYGYTDFWASPLQTLGNGAGDCEDYAILKYAALRELGVAAHDLRLVIVQDSARETQHAVLAVREQNQWLILDNRTMVMLTDAQARHYHPLFVMDDRGVRAISAMAALR